MHFGSGILDIITLLVLLFSALVLGRSSIRWLRGGGIGRTTQRLRSIRLMPLRRLSPTMRILTIVLVNVIVVSIVLELGIRYYIANFGSDQDRIRYLYSTDDILRQTSFFVQEPYLGFGNNPAYEGHNSLGFRGPEITQPKPRGTFRIVALGGSTTYGFGLSTAEEAYPAQLQRILREDYGYAQVEVINAGAPEYTSWESLVNLEFRVLDLDPDLIIYYEATNDITARLVDPDFYDGLNSARGVWKITEDNLPSSALFRLIAINLGWMDDPTLLQARFVQTDIVHCSLWTEQQCGNYTVQQLMESNPPVYYERNLRSMIAIAQANDIQVMLSSWTYFPDPLPTPVTNIYTLPWRRQAVAQLNAIEKGLADDMGTAYYDLYSSLPYNPDFWLADGYHQSALGSEAQARLYAQFLAENHLIS